MLGAEDREFLQAVALKTWRYFETFVGPEDHALPPDNVQIVPELTVAHRTSPTNIGMALLATLAAHDFGFIDTDDLIDRIEATLTTVESLERFEGHLLNWYDTRTLAPLPPAYVSTVDSGNLAGALVTLSVALPRLAAGRTTATAAARRATLDQLATRAVALVRRHELQVPLRPAAAVVHHRLSPRRRRGAGPPRSVVLRPAGLRSAAGQLSRHRQGRRPRIALVPSGTSR